MRLMGSLPLSAECGLLVLSSQSQGRRALLRSVELLKGVA